MGLAMSLNLDIDSLPPEKVEAAITRLETMKAQRATPARSTGIRRCWRRQGKRGLSVDDEGNLIIEKPAA